MTSCIQKAVQYQCASISFPVIGTGTLYYPPYLVAEEMFETVENLPPSWGIEKVKIVIYGEDDEVLKVAFIFFVLDIFIPSKIKCRGIYRSQCIRPSVVFFVIHPKGLIML